MAVNNFCSHITFNSTTLDIRQWTHLLHFRSWVEVSFSSFFFHPLNSLLFADDTIYIHWNFVNLLLLTSSEKAKKKKQLKMYLKNVEFNNLYTTGRFIVFLPNSWYLCERLFLPPLQSIFLRVHSIVKWTREYPNRNKLFAASKVFIQSFFHELFLEVFPTFCLLFVF